MELSNHTQRTITGTIFAWVLIGCITTNKYCFSGLFLIFTLLGTWEFYKLTEKNNVRPHKYYGTFTAGLLFVVCSLFAFDISKPTVLLLIIPFTFFIFIIELYKKRKDPFKNIAFTLMGLFYVAIPFSLLNFIVCPLDGSSNNYIPELLLGYFFILWANDVGAYLVGRKFGKTKLFERVSPKKSWEGSIGGAFFAIGTSILLSHYFTSTKLNLINWMVIALVITIIGSLGDLVESLFKRSINIKDSGTILPGHGGILDRFDGLLLSAPFVFAYLIFIRSINQ